MKSIAIVVAAGLVAVSVAGVSAEDSTTDQSASILVFPKVIADGTQPAPPTTTDDVVLLVRNSLRVGSNVRQVSGQVVVNDPGANAKINRAFRALPGTQLVAERILITRVPVVAGPQFNDLFVNDFTDPAGTSIFLSQGPLPVTLPLFSPFPSPATVVPGTQAVMVIGPTPVTLAAGDYGDIRIRGRGALYFEGGTYNVKSIRGGLNSRVYFNGPTTLNVAERISLGKRSVFGPPSESVLSGRCIVVNVASDRPLQFGGTSNVTATINAPDAFLRLGGLGEYRGNFVAARAKVGRSSVLEAAPPLSGPCL